ncbi:hypothetical protein [Lacipirellula parvula]|uniref:PEP-CTERM protein-sorting domain-containing protein n=1 Tax=Lacipirellula parvula TaxID=2650471 RepID=A0A5K7X5G9_9BACT|nr:hypothetical protein [Lacipirellula parvula]BBO31768.1 hypothetical protein PLANPX_1380 [Lacipirellula parvula]
MNNATTKSILYLCFATAVACAAPRGAWGHGLPIHVDGSSGVLAVSGGLNLSAGYVSQGFDYHEDAYLDFGPGNTQFTSLPGFQLTGIAANSQLNLEVLARPDFTQPSSPPRWLWFWDKETQELSTAPNDPLVRIASQKGFGDVRITQFTPPTTAASVKVFEPTSSEIGSHQHPLLYFLDDAPAAKFGAYGFFARLTSPNYGASEPFLIALNYSLSSEEHDAASRAINNAARLAGDYDRNDLVDGADFLAWQRAFGATTELSADGSLNKVVDADDLVVWKEGFGHSWPSTVGAAVVPEPTGLGLLAWALLFVRRCKNGAPQNGLS